MRVRTAVLTCAALVCLVPCTAAHAAGLAADDHVFPPPGKDTRAIQSAIAPNGYAIVAWSEQVDDTHYQLDVSVRPPGGDWSAPTQMALSDKFVGTPEVAINGDGAAAVAWDASTISTNTLTVSTRSAGGSFTTPETVDNNAPDGVGVDASGVVTLMYDVFTAGPPSGVFVNSAPAGSPIMTVSPHRLGTSDCRSGGLNGPAMATNAAGDVVAGLACSFGLRFAVRQGGTWTESFPFVDNVTPCPTITTNTTYALGWPAIDGAGHPAAVVVRTDSTSDCGMQPRTTTKHSLVLATLVGGAMAAGPTIAESGTSSPFPPGFVPNDVQRPSIGIGGGQVVVGWFAADDMGLNAKPVARVYGSNGTASPGPVESIAGAGVSGLGNLAVSDSGSALFTWPQPLNGKGTVYVASRPPAGPFGPAVQASDGSSNAYTAATELDTLGDGLVTFLQQDGTPYRAHARGFDVTPPQLTSFSVPPTAVVGMPAAFAAQAFDLWGPIMFGWDFGDGSGTGATLSHAFGGAGAHQVTVTATDSAGNASSQSGSVNVAPALAPVIAPVLSAVSLTHRTFRVGKRATAIIAKRRKKKVPTGTTIRFTLDRAASVAIRTDRSLSGRRSGKRCVKPTKRLRRAKHCTRFVKAGASLTRNAKVGRNNVGFSGRIGKRAIAPGSYRLTLVPSVPGATGKSRQTTFKVVR